MEIVLKFLIFVFLAPLFFLAAGILFKSKIARITLCILHSILLTIASIFLFTQPWWRWADQAEYIKADASLEIDTAAYRFISDNFILIDNARDKELIIHPDGTRNDSSKLVITNRSVFKKFLELTDSCETNGLIDLVVIDIKTDSFYKPFLRHLSAKKKLLLSIDPGEREEGPLKGDNLYGDITEIGNDGRFISHKLKRPQYYSLPFKLFFEMNHITNKKFWVWNNLISGERNGKFFLANNTFFPRFYLTNEKILTSRLFPFKDPAGIDNMAELETTTKNHYYLGQTISDRQKAIFLKTLSDRKLQGKKNILFIGSFTSTSEDLHETAYGPLHGPVILLNILYALQKGQHHITLLFLVLLVLFYFLITLTLINTSLKPNSPKTTRIKNFRSRLLEIANKSNHEIPQNMGGKLSLTVKKVFALIYWTFDCFLFEELHFVLLFLMVFVVKSLTGNMINALSLLLYFGVMTISLRYAAENIIKKSNR
jgi:hypothetical protein